MCLWQTAEIWGTANVQKREQMMRAAGQWSGFTAPGDNHGTVMEGKHTLYLALRHSQYPLDVVIEEDAVAGELGRYPVVFLADTHISRAAAASLEQYVLNGGTLFVTASGGLLDEYNATNTAMEALLGIKQTGTFEGTRGINNTIWLAKQNIPFAPPLDTVTLNSTSEELTVIGLKSHFAVDPKAAASGTTTVHAQFSDGKPAVVRRQVGSGNVIYAGFLPALSYFAHAYPRRPVDRMSADDSMTHFVPSNFSVAARDELLVKLSGLHKEPRPVTCSEPLVEAAFITANHTGAAIVLSNWAGAAVDQLSVTLHAHVPFKTATLATGGGVQVRRPASGAEGHATFAFAEPFEVADAIILRP